MNLSYFVVLLHSVFALVEGATKVFEWRMSYVTAAPDGVSRPVISVNGQFPPPTINVMKGDSVEIRVTNDFTDGESITLHTHGIFENGTTYYDGVPQVTQW
jgi:iron transport multicopper oxidase